MNACAHGFRPVLACQVSRHVKESLHVRASQVQRWNADFTRHLEANIEMLAVTLHVVSGRIWHEVNWSGWLVALGSTEPRGHLEQAAKQILSPGV